MKLKSLGDLAMDAQQIIYQIGPLTKEELMREMKIQFGWERAAASQAIDMSIGVLFHSRSDGRLVHSRPDDPDGV